MVVLFFRASCTCCAQAKLHSCKLGGSGRPNAIAAASQLTATTCVAAASTAREAAGVKTLSRTVTLQLAPPWNQGCVAYVQHQ